MITTATTESKTRRLAVLAVLATVPSALISLATVTHPSASGHAADATTPTGPVVIQVHDCGFCWGHTH